jgi:hypothetical protein
LCKARVAAAAFQRGTSARANGIPDYNIARCTKVGGIVVAFVQQISAVIVVHKFSR